MLALPTTIRPMRRRKRRPNQRNAEAADLVLDDRAVPIAGIHCAAPMIMNTVNHRRGGSSDDNAGDSSSERWEIDPSRSSLTFNLSHIVVQQIQGRFSRWGGTLFIDRRQPWLSTVQVWVDLATLTTDDPERDAHVRSSEILDVARFPRAEFKSTNVDITDGEVVVEGLLSLHGIVHDLEIRAQVEVGEPTDSPDGPQRTIYTARGVIDRQSFGLHWNQDLDEGGIVVGDEVEITAKVEVLHVERDTEAELASPCPPQNSVHSGGRSA